MADHPFRQNFVTAAEVGRHARVSRSAVSRTFTPGASVSSAMRLRVTESAATLGYRVNMLAQRLANARSHLVGILATEIDAPFHAELLDSLSAALLRDGFDCMLLNASNNEHEITALIARMLAYRVEAIVVMSGTPSSRIVEECLSKGVSVILVNKPMAGVSADTVMADHAAGGRIAAARLIAAGCSKLAVISSGARTSSLVNRLKAFRARAARARLPVTIWDRGATTYENGHAAAIALRDFAIDGAFCVTDLLALGFLDGMRFSNGRRVPEDVSVIGFDDVPQASWAANQLTTFRQSASLLTDAVTSMLRARALDPAISHKTVTIPVELVVRRTLRGSQPAGPSS